MINNLFFFSSQNLFSGFEVLSLPSSFGALNYVIGINGLSYGVMDSVLTSVLWSCLVISLIVCWFISWMILKATNDSFIPLFVQGLFIIPTLILSAGGYSIVLLAGVLPYLYRHYPRTFLSILMVFAPFDWIVLNEHGLGKQITFFGDTIVDVRWQLTFGLFARLFLLVFANFIFCFESYNRRLRTQ
jgi:hypothetical protein